MTSLAGVTALDREWSELMMRAPGATPFQSPAWILPWYRVWAADRVHAIMVRDREARIVALVPGVRMGARLELAGSGVGDYLAPLVSRDASAEALEALDQAMRDTMCWFADVPAGMRWPCAGGSAWEARGGSICPIAPLPASVGEWRASLPAGLQRNLRRYGERIAREHARCWTVQRAQDVDRVLEALFTLHGERWASRSERGIFADADVRRFHRASAPHLLAAGALRLHVLATGERILGVQYVLVHADRAYSYIGGFDPAWNRFSPGSLLMAFAMEQAISEGCTAFDFLRGTESYKYMWGAVDHRTTCLRHEAAVATGATHMSR